MNGRQGAERDLSPSALRASGKVIDLINPDHQGVGARPSRSLRFCQTMVRPLR